MKFIWRLNIIIYSILIILGIVLAFQSPSEDIDEFISENCDNEINISPYMKKYEIKSNTDPVTKVKNCEVNILEWTNK